MKPKDVITIEDVSGAKVIHVKTHLDLDTVSLVKDQLLALAGKPQCKIVLDLENASYISSFGLSMLLQFNDFVKKAGGRLVLAALHAFAKQVFETTQLGSVFKVYDTVEAAVKAVT